MQAAMIGFIFLAFVAWFLYCKIYRSEDRY